MRLAAGHATGYIAALFCCPIKQPYTAALLDSPTCSPTLSSPPGGVKSPCGTLIPTLRPRTFHELYLLPSNHRVQTRRNERLRAKTRPPNDSEGVAIQKKLREKGANFLILNRIINTEHRIEYEDYKKPIATNY